MKWIKRLGWLLLSPLFSCSLLLDYGDAPENTCIPETMQEHCRQTVGWLRFPRGQYDQDGSRLGASVAETITESDFGALAAMSRNGPQGMLNRQFSIESSVSNGLTYMGGA